MSSVGEKPLMFEVADYKDMSSISNLINIGRNIERVDMNRINSLRDMGYSEAQVLEVFVNDLYHVMMSTNRVDKMSVKYMDETLNYMLLYKNLLVNRFINETNKDESEYKQYLYCKLTPEEVQRFECVVNIGLMINQAVSVIIYNEQDLHTVSLLTMMNILSMLNISDEKLNYEVLKVVGRRNEIEPSDVDKWVETADLDYNVYHAKKILDTLEEFLATSPRLISNINSYRVIISSYFDKLVDIDNLKNAKTVEDINEALDGVVNYLLEIAYNNIYAINKSLDDVKNTIPEYCIDIFEESLGELNYYKIFPTEVETVIKEAEEEDEYPLTFKRKQYTVYVEKESVKEMIHYQLYSYLGVGGYILFNI